jgi:hypothetical protein
MKIGILQFELLIHDSQSLKDKRRVVRSVKDRLHREHMVSVAEVGALDLWNIAVLGLACVSRDAGHVADVLDRVVTKLRSLTEAELGEVSREILDGDQLPSPAVDDAGEPLWTPAERRETSDDHPGRGGLA